MREITTHQVNGTNKNLTLSVGENKENTSPTYYTIKDKDEHHIHRLVFEPIGELTNEILLAIVLDRLKPIISSSKEYTAVFTCLDAGLAILKQIPTK